MEVSPALVLIGGHLATDLAGRLALVLAEAELRIEASELVVIVTRIVGHTRFNS